MLDRADEMFATALERHIKKMLDGENGGQGLRGGLKNSQTWEKFQRNCGVIEGYEAVLEAMQEIAQRMNVPEVRNQYDRSVN